MKALEDRPLGNVHAHAFPTSDFPEMLISLGRIMSLVDMHRYLVNKDLGFLRISTPFGALRNSLEFLTAQKITWGNLVVPVILLLLFLSIS